MPPDAGDPNGAENVLLAAVLRELGASYDLVPVALSAGQVLTSPEEPVEFVHFVDEGLVTMLAGTSAGQTVEVATVGREGIIGAIGCLGPNFSPFESRVQVAGRARRVVAKQLCEDLSNADTPLGGVVLQYLHYEFCQVTQSGTCARFHGSSARVAKWLLIACERLGESMIPLTHDAIAQVVGGPRHEVSRDLARLESRGALQRGRACVRVLDTAMLRAAACECYDRVLAAHRRLLDK